MHRDMRVGEIRVQQRAERVRMAVAHRVETALLEFDNSILVTTRPFPVFCATLANDVRGGWRAEEHWVGGSFVILAP